MVCHGSPRLLYTITLLGSHKGWANQADAGDCKEQVTVIYKALAGFLEEMMINHWSCMALIWKWLSCCFLGSILVWAVIIFFNLPLVHMLENKSYIAQTFWVLRVLQGSVFVLCGFELLQTRPRCLFIKSGDCCTCPFVSYMLVLMLLHIMFFCYCWEVLCWRVIWQLSYTYHDWYFFKIVCYADQPLPSELNMSQLLSILYEQGVAHGQTFINLLLKHSPRTADGTTDESRIGRSGLGW